MDRHTPQQNIDLSGAPLTPTRSLPDPPRPKGALTPTEEMRRAKGWLEVIENPPRPDRELLAIHGWLSPDGTLYACAWERHNELTTALGFVHESEIEAAGYCKLSQLRWLVQPRYSDHQPTAEQWETIERWYERNGFPEAHFQRLTSIA